MGDRPTIEDSIRRHLLRYADEGCDLRSSDLPYRLATSLGLDPNMTTHAFAQGVYGETSAPDPIRPVRSD
jgi:hypothetical protein